MTATISRPALTRRASRADAAAVAVPAALAAVLSSISLTGRSLGFDEGATVAIASQHGRALGAAIAHDGGNMSAYYLLMHVLVGAFGDGLVVLRVPSVVFTVATVAVVGVIGLRLFDRRVAALAAGLTALSLPLVYWAQTARGYAPMVAFTCAGMLAFIALVRTPAPGGRPWLAGLAYVVAMVLACYCSFVAVLVVPVQLLALIHRPGALRRYAAALAALAVCGIPLAILAVRRGSGQLFWVPAPSHQVETQVLQSITSSGLQPSFHRVLVTTVGYIVIGLALIVLGGLVLRARRARPTGARGRAEPLASWGMALTLAWIVVPGALTFVYSLVSHPIFLSRNLLISVPPVSLALAVALCHRRLPRWAVAGALVAVVVIRAVPLAASYGVSPEPWREVTETVLAHARPGDCIAFYPEDGRNAFRYYVGRDGAAGRAPRSILPVAPWSATRPFVENYATLSASQLAARGAGCRRLWLVASHVGQRHGPARSRSNLAAYQRLQAQLAAAFGPGRVRAQGYASAIYVQLLPGLRGG